MRAVLLDISKAFDRVWQRGLIAKSRSIGVEGKLLNSLRGRRLKGKGKGVLGARETRGAREEGGGEGNLPPSSRAPRVSLALKTPFPFPFKRLPRRLIVKRLVYKLPFLS